MSPYCITYAKRANMRRDNASACRHPYQVLKPDLGEILPHIGKRRCSKRSISTFSKEQNLGMHINGNPNLWEQRSQTFRLLTRHQMSTTNIGNKKAINQRLSEIVEDSTVYLSPRTKTPAGKVGIARGQHQSDGRSLWTRFSLCTKPNELMSGACNCGC